MNLTKMSVEKELEVISKILNKQTRKAAGLTSRMEFIEAARNYDGRVETLNALQDMLDEAMVVIYSLRERHSFLHNMQKCSEKTEE